MEFVVPDSPEKNSDQSPAVKPSSGGKATSSPAGNGASKRDAALSVSRPQVAPAPEPEQKPGEPSAAALFDLYEKIAEAQPGSRDAEIFEKIREWTFSDFSKPPHDFAGISKAELEAWQQRHRINLSSGRIRPDPVDIQRGHAWGHIRLAARANSLHGEFGPPSAEELILMSPTQRALEAS
jgi:hypothetical protein